MKKVRKIHRRQLELLKGLKGKDVLGDQTQKTGRRQWWNLFKLYEIMKVAIGMNIFHQISEFVSFNGIKLKQIKRTHYFMVPSVFLDLLPKKVVVEAEPSSRFRQELDKLMYNKSKKGQWKD